MATYIVMLAIYIFDNAEEKASLKTFKYAQVHSILEPVMIQP